MNSATDMGGNRTCIYLYAGLKAGENICKRKIFELRKKRKKKERKKSALC